MTTATATKLTIPNLKRFDRDPRTLALRVAVLTCRSLAKKRRAQVDAYYAPVFAQFSFVSKYDGTPITKPRDLYLSGQDEECARYYAACDAANRKHGYDLPDGHCPALCAEYDAIKAENALLGHAETYFDVDFNSGLTDVRDAAVKLFLVGAR